MTPRVSICVPNLNTRRFLPERFQSIRKQSYQDWELLVYDSFSDDGAWQYICELAADEPRARAWQGPREGTPGSWTPVIREARGEYVYIATSDDTMPPDCIQKLVRALDDHPECDLAHCGLRKIDENGHPFSDSWSKNSLFARSSGRLLKRLHVRRAPFDGLLHLLGGSLYISITQLLIRRSVFDRIGMFQSTWGSVGDFNWSMRAGLAANTVHVPDTWGGWRVHAAQATAGAQFKSPEHASRIESMIDDAVAACGQFVAPSVREHLPRWMREARDLRAFHREVARLRAAGLESRRFVLREACAGSVAAREYLKSRLLRRSFPDWVRRCLGEAGFDEPIVEVPRSRTPSRFQDVEQPSFR